MTVQLNGELLSTLIESTGGVDAFLYRWSAASEDGSDNLDQATVYRWMNGQLPKNSKRFLRLCAVTDLDPFALLSVPDGNTVAAAEELLEFYQTGRPIHAALRFLRDFFGRRNTWPPTTVASDYFGRPWETHEFTHDPAARRNFYATIKLADAGSRIEHKPQVFHFAFRHPTMFAARWLQYGSVMRHKQKAILWHINGHAQEVALGSSTDPTIVKTWFGAGPAIFRIASLHPFSLVRGEISEDWPSALVFPA